MSNYNETCKWTFNRVEDFYMSQDEYFYLTSCNAVCKLLDDLLDMEFKFCPYCGKKIAEIKP